MLIRLSLILVVIAALGAGVLGYLEVSKQIPALIQQRDNEIRIDLNVRKMAEERKHAGRNSDVVEQCK